MAKKKAQRNKRYADKFKVKHPEGRVKFAAKKELTRQGKRQSEHILRGKVGHNPVARKILK